MYCIIFRHGFRIVLYDGKPIAAQLMPSPCEVRRRHVRYQLTGRSHTTHSASAKVELSEARGSRNRLFRDRWFLRNAPTHPPTAALVYTRWIWNYVESTLRHAAPRMSLHREYPGTPWSREATCRSPYRVSRIKRNSPFMGSVLSWVYYYDKYSFSKR